MPRTSGMPAVLTAAVFAVLALALGGCASPAQRTDASAADASSIAEHANSLGIATDLVYTTEVDGYDLAPQSVGASGADGISATWVNGATGAMLTLRTERGDMTAASCVATPMWEAPDETVACVDEDGGVWHRSAGDIHEYVAIRDGAMIRITGMDPTSPEALSAAAKAAHVPSDAELDVLFSDAPEIPTEPVERGDIPENGDGAPVDPVGPGG